MYWNIMQHIQCAREAFRDSPPHFEVVEKFLKRVAALLVLNEPELDERILQSLRLIGTPLS